jgi:hypothetical protein
MARRDVCGNDYDRPMRISQGGRTMTFASFECAIEALAPNVRTATDRPWHRGQGQHVLLRTWRQKRRHSRVSAIARRDPRPTLP